MQACRYSYLLFRERKNLKSSHVQLVRESHDMGRAAQEGVAAASTDSAPHLVFFSEFLVAKLITISYLDTAAMLLGHLG